MTCVLAAVATVAWLILTLLAVADLRSRPRRELRKDAHGAWLLSSVATSGLAITAADLATHMRRQSWIVLSALALGLGPVALPRHGMVDRAAGGVHADCRR